MKEIKKSNPKANVIIVSAVGQEQMVREAMGAGAKGYIVKPFNASKVAETVKEVLNS